MMRPDQLYLRIAHHKQSQVRSSGIRNDVSSWLEMRIVSALVVPVLQSNRKARLEIEKLLVVAPRSQGAQLRNLLWTERVRNLEN